MAVLGWRGETDGEDESGETKTGSFFCADGVLQERGIPIGLSEAGMRAHIGWKLWLTRRSGTTHVCALILFRTNLTSLTCCSAVHIQPIRRPEICPILPVLAPRSSQPLRIGPVLIAEVADINIVPASQFSFLALASTGKAFISTWRVE